jgi:hypothetical protein
MTLGAFYNVQFFFKYRKKLGFLRTLCAVLGTTLTPIFNSGSI